MPNERTSADGAQVGADPKEEVLRKIAFVCHRIVQAKAATRCWQVKYYRVHTAVTVVCSVLGSAGLIKKQYDLAQMHAAGSLTMWDWEFLGALFALVVAVILELCRAFGIDKTAMQAISAEDSFSLLLKDLENALECNGDPRSDLVRVWVKAKALGDNFHDVLRDDPKPEDVGRLTDRIVSQFQKNWIFPVTKLRRKTR